MNNRNIDIFPQSINPALFHVQLICDEQTGNRDKNSDTHTSLFFFQYVKKGKGTVTIDDVHFHVNEGDSFYIPSGKKHIVTPDKKDPWEKIWIACSGELIEQLLLLYRLSGIYYFKDTDCRSVFKKFYELLKLQGQTLVNQSSLALHELLIELSNGFHRDNRSKNILVDQTKFRLEFVVDTKVTIKNLSRQLQVSEDYLIRVFKKETGQTPYEYMLLRKVEYAKNLLNNTPLKIFEIADQLGFSDMYHFSNFFKKKVGVSPKKFRSTVKKLR